MSSFFNPLIKIKVGIFYHSCQHNPNVPLGFNSCEPEEIAMKLKELGTKAVIIVGVYDDKHIQLYKEAILRAGINPLLARIVDFSWGEKSINENRIILENAWTADLSRIEEKSLPAKRREIITGKLPLVKDRIDKPVYIQDMCKGLYRACTLCEESCPYGAIKIDKKSGIILDYEKCTSCGICVSSCPMSALEFPSVSQHSIFELSKNKSEKVISCYKDHDNSIKVPCIAMLSAEDIILLRSNGKLTLKCPGCELSKNLGELKSIIMDLNDAIGGISLKSPEGNIEMKEEKNISINFSFLSNRNDARKTIIEKNNLPDVSYNAIINDNSCTLCESCAKWCPTTAITLQRSSDKEELIFNPKECMGCNICVNVCPEGNSCNGPKAIKIEKSKEVLPSKTIMEDYLVRCRVCGEPVGSRKSLNLVKKIMKEKGAECEDEWLERCPKHRAEYAFQQKFGAMAKFKPRKFGEQK